MGEQVISADVFSFVCCLMNWTPKFNCFYDFDTDFEWNNSVFFSHNH